MTFRLDKDRASSKRLVVVCDGCGFEESWKWDKLETEQAQVAQALRLANSRSTHVCDEVRS